MEAKVCLVVFMGGKQGQWVRLPVFVNLCITVSPLGSKQAFVSWAYSCSFFVQNSFLGYNTKIMLIDIRSCPYSSLTKDQRKCLSRCLQHVDSFPANLFLVLLGIQGSFLLLHEMEKEKVIEVLSQVA